MVNSEKQRKIDYDSTKHYTNSNEGKMLRKLMAENNMSREEVLNHKKFRKLIADARNAKGNKTHKDRRFLSIVKQVTKELKLPKSHPDVVALVKSRVEDNNRWLMFSFGRIDVNNYLIKYKMI